MNPTWWVCEQQTYTSHSTDWERGRGHQPGVSGLKIKEDIHDWHLIPSLGLQSSHHIWPLVIHVITTEPATNFWIFVCSCFAFIHVNTGQQSSSSHHTSFCNLNVLFKGFSTTKCLCTLWSKQECVSHHLCDPCKNVINIEDETLFKALLHCATTGLNYWGFFTKAPVDILHGHIWAFKP